MKRGLPLSWRIFLWFLLNLALLAVLFWGLFRGQLGLGLDSLLTGRAGDRLQSMSDVLAGELRRTPQADWNDVISRTSGAYGVRLGIVRMNGRWWAGERLELPAEVRNRLMDPRFGNRGNPGEPPGGPAGPEGWRNPQPGPPDGGRDEFGRDRPTGGSGLRGNFRPEGNREWLREGDRREFPPLRDRRTGPQGTSGNLWEFPGEPGAPPGDRDGPRGEGNGPGRMDGPRIGGIRPGGSVPRPFLERAGNPPLYFAGVLMGGLPGDGARGGPAVLLAVSESLTAGGWVIDPAPWLMAGFGAVLLSLLLWFPLVQGITRSISAMTRATERIAEGNFDTVAQVKRSDELGRLAHSINHLAGRLDHFVNGQRRFLGDIAHELCSPLARMQLGTSLLERGGDAAHQERVADVQEEVEVMTQLVNELLSFSKAGLRARDTPLESVPLAGLVRNVISREAGDDGRVECDLPETLTALADSELLGRAVANLVRNALRYAGHAGKVTVSGRERDGMVLLTVSDHGPGVPEGELERIFEPFYRPDTARTREAGGSGLGLAIVRTCVEACQGSVAAANHLPSGLSVTIRLAAAGVPDPLFLEAAERGETHVPEA